MQEANQDRLEALLLEERDRTLEALHHVEEEEEEPQAVSSGDHGPDPSHVADSASDTQEQEADFLTATRLSAHLAEVDDALRRLRDRPDEFGLCSDCGRTVDDRRLELVPWTQLCVICARKSEIG